MQTLKVGTKLMDAKAVATHHPGELTAGGDLAQRQRLRIQYSYKGIKPPTNQPETTCDTHCAEK